MANAVFSPKDFKAYVILEGASDALNGNGPSGYNLEPSRVTMWKIEFGWYGAIGARFYAYIPAGNGEARVGKEEEISPFNVIGRLIKDKYSQETQLTECVIGVK